MEIREMGHQIFVEKFGRVEAGQRLLQRALATLGFLLAVKLKKIFKKTLFHQEPRL
jgi:hypothetical protein